MRTYLDIDDDILQAAMRIAQREAKTVSEVISTLARDGLLAAGEPRAVHGFRPFPARGGIVTNDLIDSLRADEAY